jgi:hypothetical protein
MIVKILGILDIIIGISFAIFGVFHFYLFAGFLVLIGFILLIKGVVFLIGGSFASMLDILCAIIILTASAVSVPLIIIILVALYLLQKGIFSLVS